MDDFIILKKNHFHEYMILGLLVTTLKPQLLQIYRVILGVSYANLLFSEYGCYNTLQFLNTNDVEVVFTSLVSQKNGTPVLFAFELV